VQDVGGENDRDKDDDGSEGIILNDEGGGNNNDVMEGLMSSTLNLDTDFSLSVSFPFLV
jgi:hypothetical protein